MSGHGIPSFQTKSNRNLFADVQVTPFSKSEEAVLYNDRMKDNENSIEVASIHAVSPLKETRSLESNLSGKVAKISGSISPAKRSPLKSFLSKRLKKSPVKSSTHSSDAPSIFTRFYYSVAGYNANGIYRPPPVAKGVYFDFRTNDIPPNSVKTIDTRQDSDGEPEYEWLASNLQDHHRGVPIVVRRPEFDEFDELDDKKLLNKIMTKAKKLPLEPGKYAMNHIMVNAVRAKRNIPPLRRERYMDQIAREQAKIMAEEKTLFHTSIKLKNRLKEMDKESRELPVFDRIGTNIGKGKNIAEVHRFMMAALAERNNIHDKRFFAMGMGTYIADNGELYMCQIFGG